MASDTKSRLLALKKLLAQEKASTQEELREQLEKLDFEITQSTVSRDLRRLGAARVIDFTGRAVYRLAAEPVSVRTDTVADMILSIKHNGSLIVVQTSPGSASLVARHIDLLRGLGVLGTIAGDDTIFVAPVATREIDSLVKRLRSSLVTPL